MAKLKPTSHRPLPTWPLWLVVLVNLLLAGALLFWPAAQSPTPAPDIICPPPTLQHDRQPLTIPVHCQPDRRTV